MLKLTSITTVYLIVLNRDEKTDTQAKYGLHLKVNNSNKSEAPNFSLL
jgi:hypothetical protein